MCVERCPVLLVHGRADIDVPVADAHRLHAAAGRSRLLLVDGTHDLREGLTPHAAVLTDFLKAACLEAPGGDNRHSPEPEETTS